MIIHFFKSAFYIISVAILFAGNSLSAQNFGSRHDIFSRDYSDVFLRQLIDSALVHSPLLHQQDAQIKIRETEILSKKNEWMSYIKPVADLKYGSVDNIYINANAAAQAADDVFATTRYGIGASISLSVFDVADRKRQLKIASETLKIDQYKKVEIERNLRIEIAQAYNQYVSDLKLHDISQDHLLVQKRNIAFAKEAYTNNNITIEEYARVKQIASKADEEFETRRKEVRSSYYKLEVLVGVDLKRFNSGY